MKIVLDFMKVEWYYNIQIRTYTHLYTHISIHIKKEWYSMESLILQENAAIVAQSTLTEDLFTSFIEYLDASQKTVETYTRAIRQFMKYIHSSGISQPTREDVIAYREWLKLDHKPTTVQNYIVAVRLFFQWTEQKGLYPNVAEHIKGAKLDKNHKKDYLTSRQVKKVLETAKEESLQGLRDYAILALMFTGGLRTIEVARADIEDLRTAGDSVVLYLQGKGHEEKTDYIKLVPEVEDAIRVYLQARGSVEATEPLFTSVSNKNSNGRMTTRSISRIVKKALVNAGYDSDKLTAHSTRHTAVTLALMGGQKLEEVQQFARHKNLATTLIYAHNIDRAKNNSEATIAKAIF